LILNLILNIAGTLWIPHDFDMVCKQTIYEYQIHSWCKESASTMTFDFDPIFTL
jgi:hypothetical protein